MVLKITIQDGFLDNISFKFSGESINLMELKKLKLFKTENINFQIEKVIYMKNENF